MMSAKKPDDQVLRLLLSEEGWLSVDEIEDVITNGTCRHGLADINECSTCMTAELTRRQLAHLARKLGCTPEDAQSVADSLMRERAP